MKALSEYFSMCFFLQNTHMEEHTVSRSSPTFFDENLSMTSSPPLLADFHWLIPFLLWCPFFDLELTLTSVFCCFGSYRSFLVLWRFLLSKTSFGGCLTSRSEWMIPVANDKLEVFRLWWGLRPGDVLLSTSTSVVSSWFWNGTPGSRKELSDEYFQDFFWRFGCWISELLEFFLRSSRRYKSCSLWCLARSPVVLSGTAGQYWFSRWIATIAC